MTRPILLLLTLLALGTTILHASDPTLARPVPGSVHGVTRCRISLNGTWEFSLAPPDSFWSAPSGTAGWSPIHVPGECQMQGFTIEHDREFAYRRVIEIPRDFAGKSIAVRFDGVYSHARVWVNGSYVRSHHGGFTTWECDITPFVTPGQRATLVVGVTDRADEISYASGYAHHPIGGILRSVELLARPAVHISRLNVRTSFTADRKDAVLEIVSAISAPVRGLLEFTLVAPGGKHVALPRSATTFTAPRTTGVFTSTVRNPVPWDAEHPDLYTLEARLRVNGSVEQTIRQRIGFREVVTAGRELLVNGKPVKLRGACRHDIHPTLGRSTTPEQDLQDVLLAKEANFNFIRTSHYPPSPEFLEYCDEYGIYVEDESAVCFVSTHRTGPYQAKGGSQNDPEFTDRYIGQLTEMVGRDRNHPSVILWSLGNESTYGSNFQRSFDTVRALDPSRPIIFSYAHTAPDSVYCYDLLSSHYPSWDRCLHPSKTDSTTKIPVVGDEWMHVPCYCVQDLRDDPGIHDAWGESMKRAWENNVTSPFSIGGAIWGMIDEIFPLPDTTVGYGPWGIVDIWRRKKPEFWHTRKAYSPISVNMSAAAVVIPGQDLVLPVQNRFDHTDLREIAITCESDGRTITIPSPSVAPHGNGRFTIPGSMTLHLPATLTFTDRRGQVIDEEVIHPRTATPVIGDRGDVLTVDSTGAALTVHGSGFVVAFDRATGLILSARRNGEKVIEAGPFIRVIKRGPPLNWDVDTTYDIGGGVWRTDTVTVSVAPHRVVVSSSGRTDSLSARLEITVTSSGAIITSYELLDPPAQCQEAGVQFLLSPSLDRLRWDRNALWTSYPAGHIGRPHGEATKYVRHAESETPRRDPERPWEMDTRDHYLFPSRRGMQASGLPVPHDFRSRRENVIRYALVNGTSANGVEVVSDGTVAARASVRPDGRLDLLIDNEWTYLNMNWGNYERPAPLTRPYRNTITVRLFGR